MYVPKHWYVRPLPPSLQSSGKRKLKAVTRNALWFRTKDISCKEEEEEETAGGQRSCTSERQSQLGLETYNSKPSEEKSFHSAVSLHFFPCFLHSYFAMSARSPETFMSSTIATVKSMAHLSSPPEDNQCLFWPRNVASEKTSEIVWEPLTSFWFWTWYLWQIWRFWICNWICR